MVFLTGCGGTRWETLPIGIKIEDEMLVDSTKLAVKELNEALGDVFYIGGKQIMIECGGLSDSDNEHGHAEYEGFDTINSCDIRIDCAFSQVSHLIEHELFHCLGFDENDHVDNSECVFNLPVGQIICPEMIDLFNSEY